MCENFNYIQAQGNPNGVDNPVRETSSSKRKPTKDELRQRKKQKSDTSRQIGGVKEKRQRRMTTLGDPRRRPNK